MDRDWNTREGTMPEEVRRLGLCSTCIHADHCVNCRTATRPIQFCEQFECNSPNPGPSSRPSPVAARKSNPGSTARPEPPGLKGLCVNCECRFDCCLPKPEGGVWHCEEYR